jgi:hypothetical protein
MDDFTVSGLQESKNEWAARLLTILAPHIIDGFRSILDESTKLCSENDEMDKYLMTFQNLIARIPKWNSEIMTSETQRIIEKSGCGYLEDLITCIHVIQLKILTAVRVGQKQKKVDLNVMSINDFIHKAYINSARQMYKNVYLFDLDTPPLQRQKNNREIEMIVQECILNTIRDSIPVETILKCYMDETTEDDITEEVKEEDITPPAPVVAPTPEQTGGATTETGVEPKLIVTDPSPALPALTETVSPQSLSFNDVDSAVDTDKNEFSIVAPKTISRLQEISDSRHAARMAEEEEEDNDSGGYGGGDKLVISGADIKLDEMDIHNIDEPMINTAPVLLTEIEILD